MPPRRKAPATSLTVDDLARLRAALTEGKRPTVYLRDAVPSLGLAAASSARVVSVQDGAVTVRPKGVSDEVPFEPAELYSTRSTALGAASSTPTDPTRPAAKPRPTPPPTPPRTVAPVRQRGAAQVPSRTTAAAPRVTVTLSGTATGGWTVQCAQGARTRGKPSPVAADAVVRAVAALGDRGTSEAVAPVLAEARRTAAERVAALRAELDQAQAILQTLSRESG